MVGEHRLGKQLQDFKSWEVKHTCHLAIPTPSSFYGFFYFLPVPARSGAASQPSALLDLRTDCCLTRTSIPPHGQGP